MSLSKEMRVMKRNGELKDIAFDKILNRIKKIGQEANIQMNYSSLAMKVIDQLYDTIPTSKIDELTCEQCASLSTNHPDYGILAGRIFVSNHQKNTLPSFHETMKKMYFFNDVRGVHSPIISHELWQTVEQYGAQFDAMIDYDRDYLIEYFGLKTLENGYLSRIGSTVVERPQHLWMRVAIGIHHSDLVAVKETYDLMSQKYFTHATPTLFNAGTPRPQLSSCFLISMEEDSLDGIYNTLKDCATISKYAGGIGLHIHKVRAKGSHIRGTNGTSNGITPMLRVFNNTAKYVNQSGKRNGSFAIYLEPWHPDIESFLEMKKNHGDEEMRARDLFYALWVPDLFMERVKTNAKWSLMCPDECRGLDDVFGAEFKTLYESYETTGKARTTVNARDLWFKILDSQMETGTPYLVFKDAVNTKSNQKNIGTIKSSNLCAEITEYSDDKETAVCNLASVALPSFVNPATKEFDYDKLHAVVKVVTSNLNKIIDVNFYPTEKTRRSNLRHRPIGVGVQGLADTFILMDIAYHSEEAKTINKLVFETIYHASLERSNEIAKTRYIQLEDMSVQFINNCSEYKYDDEVQKVFNEYDRTAFIGKGENTGLYRFNKTAGGYSTFAGSPASKGILQFDMWSQNQQASVDHISSRYDWKDLKEKIKEYGLRNSLLVALMPTASTSQILGFNECFEPLTSNLYSRRTLAGEFVMANKYLMRELIDLGLWNDKIKNNIITNKGSIQHISVIPERIREKYKIVWEMPMKHLIDMSADRGAFVCQSQSLNLWLEDPNYNTLTSMHFYSWQKGLKTGIYYLRRKGKHQAQQFTIEPENREKTTDSGENDEHDICEMCSA